jgi:hypothetical protein
MRGSVSRLIECLIQMGDNRVGAGHDRRAVDQRRNRPHTRVSLEQLSFVSIDRNLSREVRNPEFGQPKPYPMRVRAPLRLPKLNTGANGTHG